MRVAMLLLLVGCKDEVCDLAEGGRCDGNTLIVCNDRIKMFHEKPYRTKSDCNPWTCIQSGKEAACVVDPKPCDPKTAPQKISDSGLQYRGILIETCTKQIGDKTYYETTDRTKCDPKTFVQKCHDVSSIDTCVPFPAPNLPNLHATDITICEGATPDCHDGKCVAR